MARRSAGQVIVSVTSLPTLSQPDIAVVSVARISYVGACVRLRDLDAALRWKIPPLVHSFAGQVIEPGFVCIVGRVPWHLTTTTPLPRVPAGPRLGKFTTIADQRTVMRHAGMYSLIVRLKLASRIRTIGRVTVAPLRESSALVGTNVSAAVSVTMPASIRTQTKLQRA